MSTIDLDAILQPIEGDNSAGEDLRYTPVYDQIKEARRADDPLDQGDWQHELKTAEWDKVIKLSVEALTEKSKDFQIAAWLTEALTREFGFEGFNDGMRVINGLMAQFWENAYPEIEEDDLDFRAAPLEFLNNTLWFTVKRIPLTDPKATSGYSWLRWEESRQVGYEETTRDHEARAEMIADGKISPEVFDSAVARSSLDFYKELAEWVATAGELFKSLDEMTDEKFGRDAPRLSDLGTAIEDCEKLITTILKEKRAAEPEEESETETSDAGEALTAEEAASEDSEGPQAPQSAGRIPHASPPAGGVQFLPVSKLSDTAAQEEAMWSEALATLQKSGIKVALDLLMAASYGAPSVREKNRYRLLMAKLCLKAERPDLARPIIEQLYALIEELALEKWESPIWLGEVIDVIYQCLTAGEPDSDDEFKAKELLVKLATIDVTKALKYRL